MHADSHPTRGEVLRERGGKDVVGLLSREFVSRLCGLAAVLGTGFLFAGVPAVGGPRSLGHLWDLGHAALFFCATQWALASVPRLLDASVRRRAFWVMSAALALAVATELLQAVFEGDAEWGDGARDLLGAAAGLAWGPFTPTSGEARGLRSLRVILAALLAAARLPAATALWDEAAARSEFPVLSELEGRFEIGRWEGGAGLSVSAAVSRSGKRSLRLDLGTEKYSGAGLVHFPADWSGFRALRFSVYNPDAVAWSLSYRIHDETHTRAEQRYDDRFNAGMTANPGWTDVEVPLAAVASAPKGRLLDLSRVRGFGLFAGRLPAPRTIYLDSVRLTR